MHNLPESLRDRLKEPIGFLLDEKGILNALETRDFIISVGDMVTYTLLKNGIEPDMAIVDFRCKRKPCDRVIVDLLSRYGAEKIYVKNPPSSISEELWDGIIDGLKICKNKTVCIIVDGEEDLASLAVISLAPSNATVIYGLPDKGVVLVDVNNNYKEMVDLILKRSDKHEN